MRSEPQSCNQHFIESMAASQSIDTHLNKEKLYQKENNELVTNNNSDAPMFHLQEIWQPYISQIFSVNIRPSFNQKKSPS
jgi:hypothetical protein